MRKLALALLAATAFLFLFSKPAVAQESHKGDFYFYWGWNWGWYTPSDITFTGPDYKFTLDAVHAKDRQSPFEVGVYLNPAKATIPQYNFRMGYFFSDKYSISFGIDHMKYVMIQDQTVKISGTIDSSETVYDGTYTNDDIVLSTDFLQFEHTDGLNYINVELRRSDEIYKYKNITLSLTEGFGGGGLYPKTNVTLLHNERNDEFHWAGYGLSAVVGLNILIYKHFFIQSEFKGGYINMPDIRTTPDPADKAEQHFFFSQANILFGARFKIFRPEKAD